MARDKKVLSGRIRLVLLRAIGDAIITADYDPALLYQTLLAFCDAAPARNRLKAVSTARL
jgi:3-dehydroquinate synthase